MHGMTLAERSRLIARSARLVLADYGRRLARGAVRHGPPVVRRTAAELRAWVVVVMAATGVAFLLMSLYSTLTGDTESRALWAGIAALAVPVATFVAPEFGSLFRRVCRRDLTRRYVAGLVVLATLFGALGVTRSAWLPGMLAGCYTPPYSNGMTEFVLDDDGVCYGLLDDPDAGMFRPAAFGRNAVTSDLERRILLQNRPLEPGDLTVVWLGALSCVYSETAPDQCADGRDYPAERDQLRALLMAQDLIERTTDHRLHVVIGDASQDVRHADRIAELVIANRAAFGPRLVVIGGGDSRDVTQRAINRLLEHGIPFIAPNLLADLGKPGRPFVDRPGYLQLAAPNRQYAEDTVRRLSRDNPKGFQLVVYQLQAPTDHYTTSLVNDLLMVAKERALDVPVSARHARSLDQIDASVCRGGANPERPTVLFFADRWTKFNDFVHRVNDVCGFSEPQRVMADGSVSRYMASTSLRAISNANWPLDYYVGGLRCRELRQPKGAELLAQTRILQPDMGKLNCAPGSESGIPYCTIEAAGSTSQPCEPNDLGAFIAPTWDAALLADALIPDRDDIATDPSYLGGLKLGGLHLTQGVARVVNGQLDQQNPCGSGANDRATWTIPMEMLHVTSVHDATEHPEPLLPRC
jgi:hypothetical protein